MKLLPIVKELEGKTNKKRRQIVLRHLKKLGYVPKVHKYRTGKNILVDLGKQNEKKLILTTHFDVFPGSPGANDNASSIAVYLGVLKQLKGPYPVRFAFFDQEEVGEVGARNYLKKHGTDRLIGVLSTEMVGHGNKVALWPVNKQQQGGDLYKQLTSTLKKIKIPYGLAEKNPGLRSDYEPFLHAGIKNAFCLTLASSSDEKFLRAFAKRPHWTKKLKLLAKRQNMPELLKHYHSPNDTSAYVKEKSLQLMQRLFVQFVRDVKRNKATN